MQYCVVLFPHTNEHYISKNEGYKERQKPTAKDLKCALVGEGLKDLKCIQHAGLAEPSK